MTQPDEDLYSSYLKEVESLLASTPTYPDLLNRRGVLRLHLGQVDGAKKDFLAALSRNGRYEDARVNLAFALAVDDFAGALDLISSVAKLSERPVGRFVDMARLCYLHGHATEAWDALEHARALGPDDPRPLHWGAYILHSSGRQRDAQRWLLRAARGNGGCVDSYRRLGVEKDGLPSIELLANEIDRLPSLPGFAEIHREAARWLYTRGQTREAVAEIDKLLATDPQYAPYATLRGWMEFLNGHHHRAERWLVKAIQCNPDYARAHEQLAHFYSANDDAMRAEHHLLRAIQLRPGFPDLRYDLASQCVRTDRLNEAVTHLRSCLAIAPGFAMARFRLGECYLKLGRFDDALSQFRLLPEDMHGKPEVEALISACLSEDPPNETQRSTVAAT